MSKIDQLIQQLCPDGVEFKKIWEVTYWDKKFNGVENYKQPLILKFKHILASELKSMWVKEGDIKLLSTGKFDGYTTSEFAEEFINEGEIVAIPSGGSANIKYYNGKFVDSGNILCCTRDQKLLNLKYFYYFLLDNNKTIDILFRGTSVKHPNMPEILEISIPIPPLEVQEEIVGILDKFTALEAELEAELEARKKQYEYYRNKLLNFDGKDVEWKTLGEVFNIKNGYTPSKSKSEYWTDGTIPWFRMEDIRTNGRVLKDSIQHVNKLAVKGNKVFPKNSIIVATSATIGEHALVLIPHLANQRFVSLSTKIEYKHRIDIKFIFYYFFILDEWCMNNTTTSSFSSVDMKGFRNFNIPIPSLTEQQRIADILDKFDTLVNDLAAGIPAEIEARRKQYEYYRNKLLTFKEVTRDA